MRIAGIDVTVDWSLLIILRAHDHQPRLGGVPWQAVAA